MAEEEDQRRARAEELRKQIREINSEGPVSDAGPEMQPGESPKEYMERRAREMKNKKPAGLSD